MISRRTLGEARRPGVPPHPQHPLPTALIPRRAVPLAASLAIWAAHDPRPAVAQGAPLPAQPVRYLLSTLAADARALWVNPAGLARQAEASLGADISVDRQPGGTHLSQYGATLASRSFALGWTHGREPGGPSTNSYAIGLGLGDAAFSAGASRRWVRGPTRASFWDLAGSTAGRWLRVSLVARNLDSPMPGDTAWAPSLVPGLGATLLGRRVDAGLEWEVATRGWRSRTWRIGGTVALWGGVALAVRADLARDLGVSGLAVAVHLEAPTARATAFTLLPKGGGLEGFGMAGALVARGPYPRR